MSENQHYEYATAAFSSANARASAEFNAEARADAQIQATLALAYEQRTANLIALWTDPKTQGDEMSGINYGTLADQIKERLGLA